MRITRFYSISVEKAALMLLGSLVYMSAHLANLWVFEFWEVTPNISWVYLPSFLRLANLLILGPFWGTCATALGGAELIFLSNQIFNGLAWLNVLASCSSAVAAYGLLHLMTQRPVALTQFKELLMLAGVYTLINPSLLMCCSSGWSAPLQKMHSRIRLPYKLPRSQTQKLTHEISMAQAARFRQQLHAF
jgi:hypothetical protein